MVQIFPKGSTLISDPPPKEILGKYEYKFSLIIVLIYYRAAKAGERLVQVATSMKIEMVIMT